MDKTRLKCRFCDWSTPRWTTGRNGVRKHGHIRVANHAEHAHRREYEAIIERVLQEQDSAPDTLDDGIAAGLEVGLASEETGKAYDVDDLPGYRE